MVRQPFVSPCWRLSSQRSGVFGSCIYLTGSASYPVTEKKISDWYLSLLTCIKDYQRSIETDRWKILRVRNGIASCHSHKNGKNSRMNSHMYEGFLNHCHTLGSLSNTYISHTPVYTMAPWRNGAWYPAHFAVQTRPSLFFWLFHSALDESSNLYCLSPYFVPIRLSVRL